jgi:hypothetical protein
MTETDPISETSCFLFSRIPDDGKKSENPGILYSLSLVQNVWSSEWCDNDFCCYTSFIQQTMSHIIQKKSYSVLSIKPFLSAAIKEGKANPVTGRGGP